MSAACCQVHGDKRKMTGMIHVSLKRQSASLVQAGLSVARVSVLTGLSRDRVKPFKANSIRKPRRKSKRKPELLFARLELFIALLGAGMAPYVAMEICGRDQVLTAIHYLFLYKKRLYTRSTF